MNKHKVKLAEAAAEAEEEERQARLGPGGLDPMEVFPTLPKAMQECFENQDIGGLQKVAETMDKADFAKHLKRCIDSGLWLPEGNKDAKDDDEEFQDALDDEKPTTSA